MAQTGTHAAGVQKRKSSSFKACLRCHRRKQRCIGFPVCSNCQSAKATCERDTAIAQRKLAGLSKEDLLDRIDSLEARLCATVQDGHRETGNDPVSMESSINSLSPIARHEPNDNASRTLTAPLVDPTTTRTSSVVRSADQRIQNGLWPDEDLGNRLMNTYLESMHRRVPFFDITEVVELHNKRHGQLTYDSATRFHAFKLYMVYAIGAIVLNLTSSDKDTKAEDYVELADLLKASLKILSLTERTEATLFGVLYRLRVSLDSNAWYEIGLAMRMAIELGMHRESYYSNLETQAADWARRLFWGVYIMERNICFSFKRPLSIAEHDIDTHMPIPSVQTLSWIRASAEPAPSSATAIKQLDLSTFVAVLTLVRIKSRMHTAIQRADRDIASVRPQVDILLQEVRHFEASLSEYPGSDQEFIQLHANNATRTLIEPFLTILDAEDPLLSICVQAAGQVCQLFKRLRLRKALGYSFPMVNSVFVAGMTMCYIVFRNTSLWTPALANDLRACSSILHVIAERNHGLRKYCDLLEIIIDGVMQHLEQTTSPTSAVSAQDRSPYNDEGAPIPFHKLKDAFKQRNFELPSTAYPGYTTDSQPRGPTLPDTSGWPLKQATGIGNTDGTRTDSAMDTYADMENMYFESGETQTQAHSWDMNFLYDVNMSDQAHDLFAYEPYTQQMMGELLAQNPFNK
jgi:hypothetical protein